MEPGLEGLFALLGGMPIMGGPGGQMGDYVLDQHSKLVDTGSRSLL